MPDALRGGAERPQDDILDAGITNAVNTLRAAGVETYESCEGGADHTFARPTIRFHGTRMCGHLALGLAIKHCWPVTSLARIWTVADGEVTGPSWEMVFDDQPG